MSIVKLYIIVSCVVFCSATHSLRSRNHHHKHKKHRRRKESISATETPSTSNLDKYGTTSYSQVSNPLPKWGVYLNPIGSDSYDNSMWHNIVQSHSHDKR